MAKDLKKIQEKKELAPITKRADDPEALFRSKAEQVAINRKEKEARKAAEKAYNEAMAGKPAVEEEDEDTARTKKMLIQHKQLLKKLEEKKKELAEELADADGSEKKSLKMQIGKNNKKIEVARERIIDLTEALEAE